MKNTRRYSKKELTYWMKRRKYYMIYVSHDSPYAKEWWSNRGFTGSEYQLFAYTDNKSYKDKFKDQRDMSQFYIKSAKLDIDDELLLAKSYQRSMLIEVELCTRSNDNGLISFRKANVIMTEAEQSLFNSRAHSFNYNRLSRDSGTNPSLLKRKYYRALETLLYNTAYRIFNDEKLINKYLGERYVYDGFRKCDIRMETLNDYYTDELELLYDNSRVDTLELFIDMYHNSLKK